MLLTFVKKYNLLLNHFDFLAFSKIPGPDTSVSSLGHAPLPLATKRPLGMGVFSPGCVGDPEWPGKSPMEVSFPGFITPDNQTSP
jgi:hypothetical protein